jgi:hypothetical protein
VQVERERDRGRGCRPRLRCERQGEPAQVALRANPGVERNRLDTRLGEAGARVRPAT